MKNKIIYLMLLMLLINIGSCKKKEKLKTFSANDLIISAIKTDDIRTFEKLLKKYDINARDEKGQTFLMYCVINVNDDIKLINIVKLLISRGANLDLQDENGNTALSLSITDDPNQTPIAKLLINNNANLNLYPKNGLPLFLLACSTYSLEIAKLLITKGLDYTIKDKDGKTGLMLALNVNQSMDAVKMLYEIGINLNEKDNNGDTALLIAARDGEPDAEDAIKFLIEHGADPNVIDKSGQTILDYLLKNNAEMDPNSVYQYFPGSDEIIEFLKKNGAKRASEL